MCVQKTIKSIENLGINAKIVIEQIGVFFVPLGGKMGEKNKERVLTGCQKHVKIVIGLVCL